MVTDKGLVKVIDFGLAKLTERTESDEFGTTETMEPRTEEGTIVGTVAYMSPEQAEGKKLDTRSDIFSFGSMLYEMLTGQRAFRGDTRASTIASILRDEPKPISEVAGAMPRDVEKLVRRCLQKDVLRRFQHMDDVKVALEELKEESESGVLEATVSATVGEQGVYFCSIADEKGRQDIRLYEFATGKTRKILRIDGKIDTYIAVSPDGRTILYPRYDEAPTDLMLVENFR